MSRGVTISDNYSNDSSALFYPDPAWEGCELSLLVYPFSVRRRVLNCLRNQNVYTIEDLRKVGKAAMMRWPNFGAGCFQAVADATGVFNDISPVPAPEVPDTTARDQTIYALSQSGWTSRELSYRFGLKQTKIKNITIMMDKRTAPSD